MHVNIITVLWGHKKYNSKDVESLYKQCEELLSIPFTLYCLTDRGANGIKSKFPIQWKSMHETFISSNRLNPFWNKIEVTKRNWADTSGISVYLDLDTMIQRDFSNILKHYSNGLYLLPGTWCGPERFLNYVNKDGSTGSNSSVMIWNSDTSESWDYFMKKYEQESEMMIDHYRGDDMLTSNEIPHGKIADHVAFSPFSGFTGKEVPENGHFVKGRKGHIYTINPDSYFIILNGGNPWKGKFDLSKYFTENDSKLTFEDLPPRQTITRYTWCS